MLKKYLLLTFLLTISMLSNACDTLRDDVLVVYNLNEDKSKALADYYASQRCIAPLNILGVDTEDSFSVTSTEYFKIRQKIIQRMLYLVKASNNQLSINFCANDEFPHGDLTCDANLDLLRDNTSLRHLVLMKGLPTKFFPKELKIKHKKYYDVDKDPAVIDDYLRFSLINPLPLIFTEGEASGLRPFYLDNSKQLDDITKTNVIRHINPKIDGRLNVGRIDGLTYKSAKALIDRVILAEENGIGGKIYWDNAKGKEVFETSLKYHKEDIPNIAINQIKENNESRYIFGLTNEINKNCNGFGVFGNYYANDLTTPPPEKCKTIIHTAPYAYSQGATQTKPGLKNSKFENVNNMLGYFGFLDYHPLFWSRAAIIEDDGSSFDSVLNLTRRGQQSCSYCKDHSNPQQCRLESKDPLKEIDTRCVGLAEGFFGYNYQSWPLAYMAAWPTGWAPMDVNSWRGVIGGDYAGNLAFPLLADNIIDEQGNINVGDERNTSLWFGDSHLSKPVTLGHRLDIAQRKKIELLAIKKSVNAGKLTFNISFHYKYKAPATANFSKPKLHALISLYDNDDNKMYSTVPDYNIQCDKGVLADGSEFLNDTNGEWQQVTFTTTFDVNKACTTDLVNKYPENLTEFNYSGLSLRLYSNAFNGQLGIDDVKINANNLKNADGTDFTFYNASFDQGFRQNATGDHASILLSRLNGAAFWGSASHHNSRGGSFTPEKGERGDPLNTFIKGLPLSEAAAINSTGRGSGIFYGDPLYSPIAVSLDPLNIFGQKVYMFFDDKITLNGSARNGMESFTGVLLCTDNTLDFAACNNWDLLGYIANSDQKIGELITIPTTSMRLGKNLIKLNVNGRNGTFNDFMIVNKADPYGDFDKDGVPNYFEVMYGFSNTSNFDTSGNLVNDKNGNLIADEWELYYFRSDEQKAKDNLALQNNTPTTCDNECRDSILNSFDPVADSDLPSGDGLSNAAEYMRGSNPLKVEAGVQVRKIHYHTFASDGGNGSYSSPYNNQDSVLKNLRPGDELIIGKGDLDVKNLFAVNITSYEQTNNIIFNNNATHKMMGNFKRSGLLYSKISKVTLSSTDDSSIGINSSSSVIAGSELNDVILNNTAFAFNFGYSVNVNRAKINNSKFINFGSRDIKINGSELIDNQITLMNKESSLLIDGCTRYLNNTIINFEGASVINNCN